MRPPVVTSFLHATMARSRTAPRPTSIAHAHYTHQPAAEHTPNGLLVTTAARLIGSQRPGGSRAGSMPPGSARGSAASSSPSSPWASGRKPPQQPPRKGPAQASPTQQQQANKGGSKQTVPPQQQQQQNQSTPSHPMDPNHTATNAGGSGGPAGMGWEPPGSSNRKPASDAAMEYHIKTLRRVVGWMESGGKDSWWFKAAGVIRGDLNRCEKIYESYRKKPEHSADGGGVGGSATMGQSGNSNSSSSSFTSTAGGGSTGSPGSAPHHTGSTTSQTAGGAPPLDPEVEALFQELASMRKKKNEYKNKLDEMTKTANGAEAEQARLKTQLMTARQRLQSSEGATAQVNSEVLSLKEKVRLVDDLRRDNTLLRSQVSSLAGQDVKPYLDEIDQQKGFVAAAYAKLERRERDLARAERGNPPMQFAGALNEVMQLGGKSRDNDDISANSAVNDAEDTTAAREALAQYDAISEYASEKVVTMLDLAEAVMREQWLESAAHAGAFTAMHSAALAYGAGHLRCASYDAIVEFHSSDTDAAESLTALLAAVGYSCQQVRDDTADADVTVRAATSASPDTILLHVSLPQDAPSSSPGSSSTTEGSAALPGKAVPSRQAAPFLVASSWAVANEVLAAHEGAVSAGHVPKHGVFVTPVLSRRMADNHGRCTLEVDACRSSGPGGQAVNRSETHIVVKLKSVAGSLLAKADAQDSRSQAANRQSALERLYTEKIPRLNKQLRKELGFSIGGGGAAQGSGHRIQRRAVDFNSAAAVASALRGQWFEAPRWRQGSGVVSRDHTAALEALYVDVVADALELASGTQIEKRKKRYRKHGPSGTLAAAPNKDKDGDSDKEESSSSSSSSSDDEEAKKRRRGSNVGDATELQEMEARVILFTLAKLIGGSGASSS